MKRKIERRYELTADEIREAWEQAAKIKAAKGPVFEVRWGDQVREFRHIDRIRPA